VLDAVGLTDRADDPLSELSRGMVQRAAAARAVLHDPPLLLLDEPWAGLDPAAVELLDRVIGRASGKTRVVVTHDVSGGLAEADTALGLKAGRAAVTGMPDETAVRELYR
jgi:ABC-type transporter Mla maintaining outer membrane lipid asymmetry ATPase subunit MlaF